MLLNGKRLSPLRLLHEYEAQVRKTTKVRAVLEEPPMDLGAVAFEVTLATVDGRMKVLLGGL